MVTRLFFILVLIFGSYVYAQQGENKAILTANSGSYSGDFRTIPADGKGTFRNADGTNHDARWRSDKHMRKKSVPPYRITNSLYVSRSTIKKAINQTNDVRIKIMQNGHDNTDIEDFSLAYDSGNEYRMSNTYGIQNATLPLYVKVTYRSWNVFHAVQNDVTFEFTIYDRGTWDVTIFN